MTADEGSLGDELPPLSRNQRILFITLGIFVALSRLVTRAKSLWDWDEALFSLALRHYDVAYHQPHPPGFPGYIALAKLLLPFTHNEFRALQTVNLIAGTLLFPLVFLLARELRLRFEVALTAALFVAFCGNVWLFGGTAFSDVVGLTLLVGSSAMLLRGRRSDGAFVGGSILLAATLAVRPQLLLIAIVPWFVGAVATMRRSVIRAVTGALITATLTIGAYGVSAYVTGVDQYRDALARHKRYMMRVDTIANPTRPPLHRLFSPCFLSAPRVGATSYAIDAFALVALISAIRRKRPLLVLYASFFPTLVVAWFMFDPNSLGRYTISVTPMYAIGAAEGLALVVGLFAKNARARNVAFAGSSAIVVALMVAWTLPAAREVRRRESPPVAAARWLREHARPTDMIYVTGRLVPHARYLMPGLKQEEVFDYDSMPLNAKDGWIYVDEAMVTRDGAAFQRTPGRLWSIVRHFLFQTSVVRVQQHPVAYGSGWYGHEFGGGATWSWMSRRGVITLPALPGSRGSLLLHYELPVQATVTTMVNGEIVDRVTSRGDTTREIAISSTPGAPTEVTIETDRTYNPARAKVSDDDRELGLRLLDIEWKPNSAR